MAATFRTSSGFRHTHHFVIYVANQNKKHREKYNRFLSVAITIHASKNNMRFLILFITGFLSLCCRVTYARTKAASGNNNRRRATALHKRNVASTVVDSIFEQKIPVSLTRKAKQQRARKRRAKKEDTEEKTDDSTPPPSDDDNFIPILSNPQTTAPAAAATVPPPDTTIENKNETEATPSTSQADGCTQILNGSYDTILAASVDTPNSIEIKYQYEVQTFFDTFQPRSISVNVQHLLVDTFIVPSCSNDQKIRHLTLERLLQQAPTIGGVAIGQNTVIEETCKQTKAIDKFRCYTMESSNIVFLVGDETTAVNETEIRLSLLDVVASAFKNGTIMKYYDESRVDNPENPRITSLNFLAGQSNDVSIDSSSSARVASSQQARSGMSVAGKFFLSLFIILLVGIIALLLLKKYKPSMYDAVAKSTKSVCQFLTSVMKSCCSKTKNATIKMKEQYEIYKADREIQKNQSKGIIAFENDDEFNRKSVGKYPSHRDSSNTESLEKSSADSGTNDSFKSSPRVKVNDTRRSTSTSYRSPSSNQNLADDDRSKSIYSSRCDDMGMETILHDLEESINGDESCSQYQNNESVSVNKSKLFKKDVFANQSYETMPGTPSPNNSMKRDGSGCGGTEPGSRWNDCGITDTVRPGIDQFPKSVRLFAESFLSRIKSNTQPGDIKNVKTEPHVVTPKETTAPKRFTPDSLPSNKEAQLPVEYSQNENSSILHDVQVFVDDASESHYTTDSLLDDSVSHQMSLERMDNLPVQMNRKQYIPDTIDL